MYLTAFKKSQNPKISPNCPQKEKPQSQYISSSKSGCTGAIYRAYCTELMVDWEEGLSWLLLAAREVVQKSTGFSPNELVFARTVRGPLSIEADQWKSEGPPQTLITFVNSFRHRLYEAGVLANEKLEKINVKD